MEALVVEVFTPHSSRTSLLDVLSFYFTNGMGHIQSLPDSLLYLLPIHRAGVTSDNLVSIVPGDGITYLRDEAVYGRPPYPEAAMQGYIALSCGQMS